MNHHMITRSKVGTFKPRVLNAQFIDPQEPHTILEAQQHKDWVQAMDSEYDALMKNQTWSLVPLLLQHMSLVANGFTNLK